MMKQTIYILSDSLGETAEYVCRAAVCQFACPNMEYKRIPYVNDKNYLFLSNNSAILDLK